MRIEAAAVLFAFAMAAAPSAQTARTIEKGGESQIQDPKQVVARNATEWQALWRQHAGDRPLPSVDFSKESVVAVFMGSRNTAGYSVGIVSTTEGNGVLIVRYKETAPPRDAIAAQVLTAPYDIVAIPKTTAARVVFEKAE